MTYSAYNLNKQGDNTQPLTTPFLIWSQYVAPSSVLTVASWPAYRFLRRQVRWSGIPISVSFPQFVVIHTVKVFCMVNKAEVGIFLEFSCFFEDPTGDGNLICGSSAFSKSSWNIWNFTIHVLLKTFLEKLLWYHVTWVQLCGSWTFFEIASLWDCNENDLSFFFFFFFLKKMTFPVLWSLLSCPNLLAYWVHHFYIFIF